MIQIYEIEAHGYNFAMPWREDDESPTGNSVLDKLNSELIRHNAEELIKLESWTTLDTGGGTLHHYKATILSRTKLKKIRQEP